ncbi:MAG: hypothetical protein C0191_00390 [Mucilaginibacter sp.]|nr:MAG: hypothetical protein C0191_00390 [Mucilaginibacter sp.]HEK19367.1 hypothetical protein [Bacteroidota bacterium]
MNSKLFNPIKNKIAASIALLFFVLLGAGTMMAMKAPDKVKASGEKKIKAVAEKKKANTVWYFVGNSLSDDITASNWQTNDPGLGCGSGTALPCQMTVANASTPAQLQTFLNGKSDTAIRDTYADSKRSD